MNNITTSLNSLKNIMTFLEQKKRDDKNSFVKKTKSQNSAYHYI